MSSNELSDSRLRRLVRQQLVGLRSFGVTEWNRPSGKYAFELVDTDSASPESLSSTAHPQPRVQPSQASPPTPTTTAPTSAPPSPATPKDLTPPKPTPSTPTVSPPDAPYPAALELVDRESQFEILKSTIANCTRCEKLCESRSQTVFGVGRLNPRLVFLGEAPGADEDKQGEPFVGRAGQLLTKIIGAMKLSRDDVFILNTVKCRPPMNRNPTDQEMQNCWEYLVEQLDVLQPEVICCLGSVPSRRLLNTNESISRLRGRFFQYKSSKVAVTYHPSYLLRMENQTIRGISPKRMVWDDMKMILAELGLSLD